MPEIYDNPSQDTPATASSPLSLVIRWLVVGLPLAWGIIQTLHKSMALFR